MTGVRHDHTLASRHWIAALVTGVVGLLTTIAGLLNAYPLVDFGTDEDKAAKVHGQHQLELGCLLLVLAVAALLTARCRGSAAALAGCTISAALLTAGTGTRHNLTLPALVFLVLAVVSIVLAIRERPHSSR